jgi:hypothetical protein
MAASDSHIHKGHVLGTRVVMEWSRPSPHSGSRSISLLAQDRSRVEFVEPKTSGYQIERRDLKKTIAVYTEWRKYQEHPIFELISEAEKERFIRSGRHWNKRHVRPAQPPSGKFRIRTAYEMTQEEAMFFGCLARRWKITSRNEREHANGFDLTETVTDAWYFDSEQLAQRYRGFSEKLVQQGTCYITVNNEHPMIEEVGQRPTGLCVRSESKIVRRYSIKDGDVRETEEIHRYEISGLTEELFDESLFEVPKGFRQMPVFPGRFTMARSDLWRWLQRLRFTLGRGYAYLTR